MERFSPKNADALASVFFLLACSFIDICQKDVPHHTKGMILYLTFFLYAA